MGDIEELPDKFNGRKMRIASGATFILGMYSVGQYILLEGSTIKDGLLWQSLFLGLGLGHYIGRSMSDDENKLTDWFVGAFSVVAGISLLQLGIAPLSGTLIFLALSMLLLHASGLLKHHGGVEALVDLFSGKLAILYLAVYIGGFKLLPVLQMIWTEVGTAVPFI
jgi:hypothetical protein